jgi:Arc/MetJ-type ribon-helix-helix transcriptional regulator
MPLTVRLNPKSERALSALAKRRRMSRSDLVREALNRYENDDETSGPYDAWLDVIGIVKLGARDPSRTTGDLFASIVEENARARRRPR